MSARTQDEILARLNDVADDDFLGFRFEVLVEALDYAHVKPFLQDDATAEDWAKQQVVNIDETTLGYYTFAVGKIEDHRGLSADRSVTKLREFAWLLGRDDAVEAMDAADHMNYGAPKVKAFAQAMGYAWPDSTELNRMADGLPCDDDCGSGCGA